MSLDMVVPPETASLPIDGLPIDGVPIGGLPIGGLPIDDSTIDDLPIDDSAIELDKAKAVVPAQALTPSAPLVNVPMDVRPDRTAVAAQGPAARPTSSAVTMATGNDVASTATQGRAPRAAHVDFPVDEPAPPPADDKPRVVDVVPAATQVFVAAPSPWDAPAEMTQGLGDVAFFMQAMAPEGGAGGAELKQLAGELGKLVADWNTTARDGCTFDIEVPGLGRLAGRVSVNAGQADVELQAMRTASGAALRARQQQLQRMLDRESGGDVNLFIL